MDPEKLKRRQSLKVITSEIIMFLSVVVTVAVLALIVSGYWLNSNFEVERQGMLQISSVPTGADVIIDGESSWLQKTNTSKVLSSGEHSVTLAKEGYDSWSKTINISEGLLYRLHYPRLFLKERELESVLDVNGSTMASISPDHNSLLLLNNTTKWTLIELNSENPTSKSLDVSALFPNANIANGAEVGLLPTSITSINWSRDNNHALVQSGTDTTKEWILLDIKNPLNSVNLSREFNYNFTKMQILNHNASDILAVQDGNLYKIDIPRKQISTILVNDITNYDHYGNEIVFVAANPDNSDISDISQTEENYYIGLLEVNSGKITTLKYISSSAQVAISKFYDDKYITVVKDNIITVYKYNNFEEYSNFTLNFTPDAITVGHDGEFVVMSPGPQIATLDMEANEVREWSVDGSTYGWLDDNMIYSIKDGELYVYDFDGLNRRALADNASSHFPVTISDNTWLYYFSDDYLVREWLSPR